MKQSWIAVPVLALVLLGAAACSAGQQGTAQQGTAAPATVLATRAGVSRSPEAKQTLSEQPTNPTGESLSLGSRDVGLDKLKSYRIRWQSQWSTTESGKTETANWDWLEEFSSSPEALHWNWKSTDVNATSQNSFEAWQMGDTTYMVTTDKNGQSNCVSYSTGDASQRLSKGLFSPKSLGSLSGARYVGDETVNGISTKHFQYRRKICRSRRIRQGLGRGVGSCRRRLRCPGQYALGGHGRPVRVQLRPAQAMGSGRGN